MKYCFAILSFIFLNFKCFAQANKGEQIPLLNRIAKIDSLLSNFTKLCNNGILKDSCIAFSLASSDSTLYISLFMDSKKNTEQILFKSHLQGEHIGFFKFESYNVFVFSPQKFSGLFSETSIFSRFDFLNFTQTPILEPLKSTNDIPLFGFYKYKNGEFTVNY